jgi:hypothetical protein
MCFSHCIAILMSSFFIFVFLLLVLSVCLAYIAVVLGLGLLVTMRVLSSELNIGAVNIVNTRNTHLLHRPVANLTCFQKSTYYSGINIFNNLPRSLKSLMNEKAEFEVALKRYLNTHSFYSVDEFLLPKNDSSF